MFSKLFIQERFPFYLYHRPSLSLKTLPEMAEEIKNGQSELTAFQTLTGPFVPRSHSFLPLRCGPPIYFPLPDPYDGYCLTGILPSDEIDELASAPVGEDVEMNGEEGKTGKASKSSRAEGQRRIRSLPQAQDISGWEYPSR